MSSKNKILILVPKESAFGGATSYYKNIKNEFSLHVDYLERGNKNFPYRESRIKELVRLFYDFFRFIFKLARVKLVHINCSLRFRSLFRDSFYLLAAYLFNKKIIITFHAWNTSIEAKIENQHRRLFYFFISKADAIIVLSNDFKKKILDWGYRKPVYTETTIVNREFQKSFSKKDFLKKIATHKKRLTILFLARIEKEKGIFEAMDTFRLLQDAGHELNFIVAGDGPELQGGKDYVKKIKLKSIDFKGFLNQNEVIQTYQQSDIYFFPSYSEGMPTSVLEAMTLGLPIVGRSVGGLKDFFINGKMGYLTDSYDPQIFSGLVTKLIESADIRKEMALNNFTYARNNFMADIVVKRLEKIYEQTINF